MAFHQDKTLKKLKVPKPKSEIKKLYKKKKAQGPKPKSKRKTYKKEKKISKAKVQSQSEATKKNPRPKSEVRDETKDEIL